MTALWVSLLSEVLQGLLILSAFALPVEAFAPASRWPLYGLLVLAFVLFFLLRRTVRGFFPFVAAGLALLLVPLFLPVLPDLRDDVLPRFLLGAGLLFLAGRALLMRLSTKDPRRIPDLSAAPLPLLLVVGLDITASVLGLSALTTVYFALTVLYLLLALLRWHLVSLAEQMERFSATPTQPTDRVVRFNRLLLLGALVVSTGLLLLSPLTRLDLVLPWLWQRLLAFLRWFFALLRGDPSPEPTPLPEPTAGPKPSDSPFPIDPNETPAWLKLLQDILMYTLLAAVAVGLVALIGYGFYRLYRRFNESRLPDSDRRESLVPSLTDFVQARLRRPAAALRPLFGQTPEQRIRHAFFRLVDAQLRRGLPYDASLTARERVERLDTARFAELLEIVDLFEKARYGSGTCTRDDAARMQRLVRGLVHKDLAPKGPAHGSPTHLR